MGKGVREAERGEVLTKDSFPQHSEEVYLL